MTPEQYRQVGELYHAVLELAPAARATFLDESCGTDTTLRREVESLLRAHQHADGFIAEKVAGMAAAMSVQSPKTARLGQRFSHYQVLSLLGTGAMGEVYLAEDTSLGRKAALKLLPAKFTCDQERLRRFEREARAASALNHPNILTIYEVGVVGETHFIATEYIDGQTLRERLHEGRLELREALDYASQIASALAVAHEAGIIHRDIKPENVMVRRDGLIKVLDFGLAKLSEPSLAEQPAGITVDGDSLQDKAQSSTAAGVVMGTVAYMSPEQARGQRVDHRTDIFSLGVMLYEMLAGHRPFAGATTSDVIAALLTAEPPPLSQQCATATAELERIVVKCLAKEREARYQAVEEFVVALKALSTGAHTQEPATHGGEVTGRRFAVRRWSVAVTLVTMLVIGLGYFFVWRRQSVVLTEQTRAATRPNNPAAYDDYLRGRFYATRQTKPDNEEAIKALERAVSADPNFAPAQAELAQAYVWRFFLFTPNDKQWQEKAFMAVEKALSLDPESALAHLARGRLLWTPAYHFPHEQAIKEYRRALTLNPRLDEALHQLAMVYNHIGALDLALQELQKAAAINPTNTPVAYHTGQALLFQGKYEQALTALRSVPKGTNPVKVGYHTAMALLHLERKDEAAALAEEYLKNDPEDVEGGIFTSLQAVLAALAGDERKAEAKIKSAIEKGQGFGHFHHTAYSIACAYAVLKKTEAAIQWLQTAADDGFPCYSLFEHEPFLDNLKKDPRFITLIAKLKGHWGHYR